MYVVSYVFIENDYHYYANYDIMSVLCFFFEKIFYFRHRHKSRTTACSDRPYYIVAIIMHFYLYFDGQFSASLQ